MAKLIEIISELCKEMGCKVNINKSASYKQAVSRYKENGRANPI